MHSNANGNHQFPGVNLVVFSAPQIMVFSAPQNHQFPGVNLVVFSAPQINIKTTNFLVIIWSNQLATNFGQDTPAAKAISGRARGSPIVCYLQCFVTPHQVELATNKKTKKNAAHRLCKTFNLLVVIWSNQRVTQFRARNFGGRTISGTHFGNNSGTSPVDFGEVSGKASGQYFGQGFGDFGQAFG